MGKNDRSLSYRAVCILLALELFLFGIFVSTVPSQAVWADTKAPPNVWYQLVTGVIFLWGVEGNAANWSPAAPGGNYTVHTKAKLPAGAKNAQVLWYDPDTLNLDDQANVIHRKPADLYKDRYLQYAVKGTAIKSDAPPALDGSFSYSYSFDLISKENYPIVRELKSQEGIREIREILGDYSGSLDQYLHRQEVGESVGCRMYFMPYLIRFELAPDVKVDPDVNEEIMDPSGGDEAGKDDGFSDQNSPPIVNQVKTLPKLVKAGSFYQVEETVTDPDRDTLTVLTEVYLNDVRIFSYVKTNLKPDVSGVYPNVLTDTIPQPAQAGAYRIVCTARDQKSEGNLDHTFFVTSVKKLDGWVNHTDQWDENRKKYNLKRFQNEINQQFSITSYKKQKSPRKRGTNVFWSGEQFLLQAGIEGEPIRVTAKIMKTSYHTVLEDTGQMIGIKRIYGGLLWDKKMVNHWGRKQPELLTFRFTAEFEDGSSLDHDVHVIVDSKEDFWQLHRLW